MYYHHKQANGKNSKAAYYFASAIKYATPRSLFRRRLRKVLEQATQREDYPYIAERVEYYNKLGPGAALPEDAVRVSDFSLKGNKSAYFFDTFEYLRWFPASLRFKYLFGDVTAVPSIPTIVKSRPVEGDNANSVLLNLDKLRHFTFLDDKIPFRSKKDKVIFRGHIGRKKNRLDFMNQFFDHPMCDAGVVSPSSEFPIEWSEGKKITLWQHLDYKFILALEGNDVASNLKWIMSSNAIAVTPRPVYETWFMEGRLKPDVHYIEVKPDFSDLMERIQYFIDHPAKAEAINKNAKEYIAQFLDPQREDIISLMVLDRYFRMTGQ